MQALYAFVLVCMCAHEFTETVSEHIVRSFLSKLWH